jgi:DNA-binding winged helix-turn-helix (wHTH) protein
MRFCFDHFVLDSDARELLRDGEAVHLSPKAYQLLEALVESRPKALSKSTLHDLLWPNTFVVETNLANLVVEIRGVIGDKPRRPRFLRTVYGYGYAFRAPGDDVLPSSSMATGRVRRPGGLVHRLIWEERVIPLEPGENIIGRDEDAAVCIQEADVSRRHARIVIENDAARLEDLGSKNGTYLKGHRLEKEVVLRNRDSFRVGQQLLVYSSSLSQDTTQTGAD